MSKFAAQPFSQLLGIRPLRLPKSGSITVVVDGTPVRDVRQIRHDAPGERDAQEEADVLAKRAAVLRAKGAARYQRARQDPAKMAKRQAWYEANRDKVRAYKRDWDAQHVQENRRAKAAWQMAHYQANADKCRQQSRAWYERNREAVLAKKKAQRDAARAERQVGKKGQL